MYSGRYSSEALSGEEMVRGLVLVLWKEGKRLEEALIYLWCDRCHLARSPAKWERDLL